MTDDERAALVDLAVSVVESQGYLVSYSFKPRFQAILAAIEPAFRADERKRSEAEVERLRAALREALAFIAGVNSGCPPLVARIVTALAEDKP